MKNYKRIKWIIYLNSIVLLLCGASNAQQWLGGADKFSSIFRTGKVGIGISSPQFALHVIGQVQMGHTNENVVNDFYGGTFKSFYTYRGGDSLTNPFENQGSVILGQLTYGDKNTAPVGTVHGISSKVDVINCGDSRSEMAGMFIQLRSDAPSRLWGVDLGVMGPINGQADLLTGIVNAVNNYNDSKPSNGAFGSVVISKPEAGAGYRLNTPTYSLDVGFAVVGYSNTKEMPVSVYDRALQVGGWASGWMRCDERSKFLTGIDVSDYVNRGVYIHKPQSGGKGYALIVDSDAGYVGIGTANPSLPFEVVPGEGSSFSVNAEDNRTVVRIIDNGQDPVLQIGHNSLADYVNLEYDGSGLGINGNVKIDSCLGIGSQNNTTSKLDIQGSGSSQLRLRTKFTPTNSEDSSGKVGDFAWDDNYFYIKTSSGWKRTKLSSF